LRDYKNKLTSSKEQKVIMSNKQLIELADRSSNLACDVKLNDMILENLEKQLIQFRCQNKKDQVLLREKETELLNVKQEVVGLEKKLSEMIKINEDLKKVS